MGGHRRAPPGAGGAASPALEISARGASTIGVDWKYIKWRFLDETAERKS
jgi:hypothetical protein